MTTIASKQAIVLSLSQLVISDLNLRAHDGADDQIPDLAATLAPGAAGQLIPLFVKPAAIEATFEVLDGRRRYLAWSSLLEAGTIDGSHPVLAILCETEDEVAQAVVIANAMRKEIQYADILLTLNRLLSERYGLEEIAKSLGMEVKEIRKMSALAQLDNRILAAFKQQRFRLSLLRQIARIRDVERIEALIEMLEDSEGPIQEYNIREFLDDDGVFATDAVLRAFPISAYLDKGGRIEQDLFEEHPDKILDPKILGDLWKSAMKPVLKALKMSGLSVDFAVNLPYADPVGFRDLAWDFKRQSEGDKNRVAELKAEVELLKADLKVAGEGGQHAEFITLSKAFAAKSLELFNEEAHPLVAKACKASLGALGHVKVQFYVDATEYAAFMERNDGAEEDGSRTYSYGPTFDTTPLPKTNLRPDVTLYGHAHHLRTTTLAGRALARSLVETPMVALDVQLSAQFQQVVLGRTHDAGKYVLKVCASVRATEFKEVENPLLVPVKERLDAYKAQYDESGLHPFEWISTLTPVEKLDLLGHITAIQIDMTELKTDYVRQEARAEAILIARTIGHDFKTHMAVEPDYYVAFSKKALLAILVKMGLDPEEYTHLKRGQLAEAVYDLAHERGYVPPALNFHEDDYFELTSPNDDSEVDDEVDTDAPPPVDESGEDSDAPDVVEEVPPMAA
ncbi:ParB/RepB/Spo0J family partition protein [Asticcacaulis sp. W401b]|uniref:ParB/RepB/Spo0J family partition protein n=1 Tax=Asticcacaulis sp. W401b TaxID=3388666 RepID=UPI0039705197